MRMVTGVRGRWRQGSSPKTHSSVRSVATEAALRCVSASCRRVCLVFGMRLAHNSLSASGRCMFEHSGAVEQIAASHFATAGAALSLGG